MSRVTIALLLLVLSGLAGCTAPGGTQVPEQRVIQDVEPDQVLAAAAAILQREFGRVAVDRPSRHITTAPVEYTTERESGTARDLYRGRSTMRRKAECSVGRSGSDTVVRMQVDIERRDTARQTAMQPRAHRLGDTPGEETPIDADAATTSEQNTVWTKVRRDRTLERALLDELREQFARLAAPAEEPATTTKPATRPAAKSK